MNIRFKFLLICVSTAFLISCGGEPEPPGPDSEAYRKAVSDFYVSLAASQTDEARFAFNKMNEVARAYPEEAAAWANLGVFAMRQGNFDLAADRLEKARETAPENGEILYLSGMMESRRGRVGDAITFYRQAAGQNPDDLRIRYSLMTELEREDDTANSEEIRSILNELVEQAPENQAVQYEFARIAAKERDSEMMSRAIEMLSKSQDFWSDEARSQFKVVRETAADEAFSELALELAFFRNMIEPESVFLDDLRAIEFPPTEIGFLMTRFLWLPEPQVRAAEPDFGLTFNQLSIEDFSGETALVKSVTLLEELPPFTVAVSDGNLVIDSETLLPFPGETPVGLSPGKMAEIDFNYNYRNDIALAGSSGFRFFRQDEDQGFTDVTMELGLSSRTQNQSYHGVWPADIDLDGDLDLLLSPIEGEPLVLINHADGTFSERQLFDGVSGVIDFKWADLDSDGDADALFLDGDGNLTLYRNFRANTFRKDEDFPTLNQVAAVAIGDINANGFFEILAARTDGSVNSLHYNQRYDNWEKRTLIESTENTPDWKTGETTMFVADLDNNGSFDLIISGFEGTGIWLSDDRQQFELLDIFPWGKVTSIYDVNGNERLDLIGTDVNGNALQWMNSGTKPYHAYSIRARASGLEGDQRINSFGIGGEMEIRSGLLYQKQQISSPILHFGLGEYEEAELLRIIWPNGSVQAEFAELGMGATIFNEQVLKGSCPWLFTSDGEEIHFITDILWRSPLGLRINAQETAGVIQTLDRVRVPGDKLNPVDGIYDIRITAELWETHFFDYVSLIAVDHPEGTEMFVDERFVFPPPDLSAKLMTTPVPVKRVSDQWGNNHTETVSAINGNYIAPFQKTSIQGLVEQHYIEIEIGDSVSAEKPIWLIAHGWLRPTDSSLNLSLSQGSIEPPSPMEIHTSDGQGGWNLMHGNYGVPAGKAKTITLDLQDAFEDVNDRRVRIYTSSEIHWDGIFVAEHADSSELVKQEILPETAELRYRGFSHWHRADSISPKLPDYSIISSTNQRWRDLVGYHTRFGDVLELLEEIDDRYVIMNAGDEMLLRFQAPDDPKPGFKRTYIFVSDGWVKDGDYNTEASKTVLPLPFHGQADYEYLREGRLIDDPVYRKHQKDWKKYHTRYITPESFRTAILLD